MKLIDLLVKELPKRGGWPNGALSITQDNDSSLCVWDTNDPHYDGFSWKHHTGNSLVRYWNGEGVMPLSFDYNESIVTYWQYKGALAASQKPAWNGEDLPPVGCECECQFLDAWHVCKVLFVGEEVIVGVIDGSERAFSVNHTKFRPLQSEAERKRDAAINNILTIIDCNGVDPKNSAIQIYDAIAAGKIPGVKLED